MNAKKNHITLFLVILAIGISVKNIFTNFNIDSAFQLVMDYRWAQGDHYFAQMWEPYMMSTFLTAPFVKLYLVLFHTTTGIVLYMQLIGVLIKAGLTLVLYKFIVKHLENVSLARAMAFLFFLIYPKDLPFAEYSNMEMYFTLLLGLTLFAYLQSGCKWQLYLSALWMCCLVLSYPSNLLVAIAAFFVLVFYGKIRDALLFTATCVVAGAAYILLILRHISFTGLKESIHGMLAIETSHSASFLDKMWLYFLDAYKYALLFLILHILTYGIAKIFLDNGRTIAGDIAGFSVTTEGPGVAGPTSALGFNRIAINCTRFAVVADSFFLIEAVIVALYVTLYQGKYTKFAYALLLIGLMMTGCRYRKLLNDKSRMLYRILSIFSVLNFLSTILLTNLNLAASFPYLLVGAVAALIPLASGVRAAKETAVAGDDLGDVKTLPANSNYQGCVSSTISEGKGNSGKEFSKNQDKNDRLSALCRFTAIIVFGFLVARSCILIQPLSGEIPTLFQIRGLVKQGPATGIVTSYMGAYMQNESYAEWQDLVPEGSKIYLVGDAVDVLGYLYKESEVAGPSTVPTPGYNDSIAAYWQQNPDKYPDVIVCSCWYGETALAPDDWMLQYLETTYPATTVVDGKYWRYYIR